MRIGVRAPPGTAPGACTSTPPAQRLHGHTGNALQHVDSLCFNPHKWLLTNFDCDAFWTRDRESLIAALSITPEYLRNAASTSSGTMTVRAQ